MSRPQLDNCALIYPPSTLDQLEVTDLWRSFDHQRPLGRLTFDPLDW